ncbi:hypothetical protein HMN09_00286700 [Mycena chlorophos]|uniref:Uncharacterized protein n=1 Tax=Mycena chlorophos TaxID=658473 RepID=A0A8H6WP71_MYCCL|nr:hypothetical protein HMN09_00286700 [Mycena chlorophos]
MESRPFDDRPSRSQQQRNNRSSSAGTRRSDTQTIAADDLRRSSLWSSTTQDPIDTYTTSASATNHALAGTGPPYDTSVLGQLQADLRLLREGRIRDQQQHEAMLQERMRRLEGILESGLERQIAMSQWTSAQPDDFRREIPRELRAQRPTVASEYQRHQAAKVEMVDLDKLLEKVEMAKVQISISGNWILLGRSILKVELEVMVGSINIKH